MEPRIQYAKTEDGVSIAYWIMGEGPALVCDAPLGHSHLHLEWEYPPLRDFYERLAEQRTVVRFDYRGWGMSQRDGFEFSVEGFLMDIDAVVERLGLVQYAMLAFGGSGPYAIAHAARQPEQVSQLVLWEPVVYWPGSPQVTALRELLDKDWELYTEAMAHSVLGWSQGADAHRWAKFIRESVSQEALRVGGPVSASLDVSGLLARVPAPTLLLARPKSTLHNEGHLRELAAGLPNARIALLEGPEPSPFMGDVDSVLAAIDDFLGDPPRERRAASGTGALATILFTDLASSTALTRRLGDAKAQELVRAHNMMVREALNAHGGAEIKHTGDGIMASFGTASGTVQCAIDIQRAVALRQAQSGNTDLAVHIGVNAGEPVAEESDLFGTSVQLARRICDHASSGQILVSNVVRELAAGKGFLFADVGEVVPKGFDEAVRLYEVRWRDVS